MGCCNKNQWTESPKHPPEELFASFQSTAELIGFECYSVLTLRSDTSPASPFFTSNNLPDSWNRHYHKHFGWRNSPIIEHCHHSLLPVLWTESLFHSIPSLWEDMQRFGVQHGVSLPVHDSCGFISIFSFLQAQTALSPEQLYERIGSMLWLANRTHMQLTDQFRVTEPSCPLTARELES